MNRANSLKKIYTAKLVSPVGFLRWAIILGIFFGVCHLAGWRENTSFISGTGTEASAVLGLVYLISYFGFVIVVPVLVLAAGIWTGIFALCISSPQKTEANTAEHFKRE